MIKLYYKNNSNCFSDKKPSENFETVHSKKMLNCKRINRDVSFENCAKVNYRLLVIFFLNVIICGNTYTFFKITSALKVSS